ncbi:hypothetical protein GW755_01120 [bacterium]|nr:hypothetical protein [bacterium]
MSIPKSQYSVIFFSLFVFVGSFFYFNKNDKQSTNVKGTTKSREIQTPVDALVINQDSTENSEQIVYTTRFTKDQLDQYYKELSILEGWKQISPENYTLEGKNIYIKVEKESEEKNLVTLEYENN